MALKVTLNNSAGPIETEVVNTEEEAADVAVKMIERAGLLYPGDSIQVEEIDG